MRKGFRYPITILASTTIWATAGIALAADFELIAGTQGGADSPFDKGLTMFESLVEDRSDGRIDVQVFPNAQLGNESELFQGVAEGTIDLAVIAPGNIAEFVPQIAILEMPFVITSLEQRDRVIEGSPLQTISGLVEEKTGAVIVGIYGGGTRNMFFKEPVSSVDDLQGRRFRVQASRQLTDSYTALGLEPTVTSYQELYGALQQGIVEGAEMEAIYVELASFPEVATNFLMTRHVVAVRPVVMSGETLARLPDDLRTIVLDAMKESAKFERDLEATEDQASLTRMADQWGATFTEVDVSPMIAKVRPVWERYAEQWGLGGLLEEIEALR